MIDIARAEERQGKTDDIDGWMYVVLRARSDYGFDPLKLGEKPENLARYREAELMHARWRASIGSRAESARRRLASRSTAHAR